MEQSIKLEAAAEDKPIEIIRYGEVVGGYNYTATKDETGTSILRNILNLKYIVYLCIKCAIILNKCLNIRRFMHVAENRYS